MPRFSAEQADLFTTQGTEFLDQYGLGELGTIQIEAHGVSMDLAKAIGSGVCNRLLSTISSLAENLPENIPNRQEIISATIASAAGEVKKN